MMMFPFKWQPYLMSNIEKMFLRFTPLCLLSQFPTYNVISSHLEVTCENVRCERNLIGTLLVHSRSGQSLPPFTRSVD